MTDTTTTLGRDQILAADDMPTDYVEIPRWGGKVRVQAARVGSFEYVRFVNRPIKSKRNPGPGEEPSEAEKGARRQIAAVIMSAIDENGDRLFSWDDADKLRDKHWNSVAKIATKAFELAGRDEEVNPSVEILGTAARIYNGIADKDRELWEPVLDMLAEAMKLANDVWAELHPTDEDGNPIEAEVVGGGDAFAAGKGSSDPDPTSETSTPSD